MPPSFADLVERVKPSVVSIFATTGGGAGKVAGLGKRGDRSSPLPEGIPDLPDDHPLNEFFKRFGKGAPGIPQPKQMAQGSGFIISDDGYVVTNNHVIDGATKIEVSIDDQNKMEAELIGTDQRTDLALLKIKEKKSFPSVKFSDKLPRVGDWVIAVGNPFGLGGTVTAGIVSAHGRDINSGPYDYMQIDAAVNRGNSGGPTFDMNGEVVGVNTAIYSPTGGSVGIAFAVPAKTAVEVIAQLKSKGSVSRGWLGVRIEAIDKDKADALGLKDAKGALVAKVEAGSPALTAGVKEGDAILAVNNDPINDSRDLARKIGEMTPNATANLKIYRDGKEQVVPVKLGTLPGAKELAKMEQGGKPAGTDTTELGLTLAPNTPKKGANANADDAGVLITGVEPDSDAADKGLREGDVILKVNNKDVKTPEDVQRGIKDIKTLGRGAVMLQIKTGDQVRMVPVKLKKG